MPSKQSRQSHNGNSGAPTDSPTPTGLSQAKTPVAPAQTSVTPSHRPITARPTKLTVYNRTFHGSLAQSQAHLPSNTFRILSIDGGGARGMIPAVILKEVERRSGRRVSQLFDRICGTSTGAILACGLATPQSAGSATPMFHAREIVEIYRTLGEEIFSRGSFAETVLQPMDELLDRQVTWIATHAKQALDTVHDVWERLNKPLHDVHKLAYMLYEYLGDLKLKDALTELFVYAYDIGSRTPEILGSTESSIPGARNYANFRMYQAATASSAAVPFFAPYTVWKNPTTPVRIPMPLLSGMDLYPPAVGSGDNFDLIDGGNGGLGNPALFATIEDTQASAGRNKMILSLGTGHFSQPVPSAAKNWGFVQWLGQGGELLKSMFDGEADVTDMALRQILEKDVSYFRWQPSIPESLAFLDEGSREDMNALEDVAQAFIAENDEEIDALVAILTKPRLVRVP
jgi:predicted acylesterase/phospholipase RssA